MANQTDRNGGPFIFSDAVNAEGAPDDTAPLVQADVGPVSSILADTERNFRALHNPSVWHKGLNADLVDSKHAAYLTTAVNETDIDHPDLNDSTPAVPSGGLNVKWQAGSAQNSRAQTPVSAYVPLGGLSVVTPVGTDHVVITDASDSDNPKRALVSDITALVPTGAPADAQYVTLATNATLTNERVLTAGTGLDLADAGAGSTITIDLDLNELSNATAASIDYVALVDADDNLTKKATVASILALAGDVTAASNITDNVAVRGDGGAKGVQGSDIVIRDSSGGAVSLVSQTNLDLKLDVTTNTKQVRVGTDDADAVEIGRTSKSATVNGALSVNEGARITGQTSMVQTSGSIICERRVDSQMVEQTYLFKGSLATSANVVLNVPIPTDSGGPVDIDFSLTDQTDPGKYWHESRKQNAYNSGGTASLGGAADTVVHTDNVSVVADGATVVLGQSGANLTITVTAGATIALRYGVFVTVRFRTTGA